jgi:hypothetical protein
MRSKKLSAGLTSFERSIARLGFAVLGPRDLEVEPVAGAETNWSLFVASAAAALPVDAG